MMEYIKIYPERLAKCREIIEDAVATSDKDEISAAYELLGRLFYAAMGYAFEDTDPGFGRRSIEGAEWRDWRSDLDRASAKTQQMRELGTRGGKASVTARGNQVSAEATLAKSEAMPSDASEMPSDASENRSDASNESSDASENRSDASNESSDASENTSDATEKSSPNTKTKTKANSKAKTKSESNPEAYTYTKTDRETEVCGVAESMAEEMVEEEAPQPVKPLRLVAGGRPSAVSTSNPATDAAVSRLIDRYPDANTNGFILELLGDVRRHGEQKTEQFLREAEEANAKDKVSIKFYRKVKQRILDQDAEMARFYRDRALRQLAPNAYAAGVLT